MEETKEEQMSKNGQSLDMLRQGSGQVSKLVIILCLTCFIEYLAQQHMQLNTTVLKMLKENRT